MSRRKKQKKQVNPAYQPGAMEPRPYSEAPKVTQTVQQNGVPVAKMQVTHTQQIWQGPLPPPNQLAAFDEIQPGLAGRIVQMAEKEGEHSRMIERRQQKWSGSSQIIGQVFAASLAIGCMIAAYRLAIAGHDGVAAVLGGGTLTTVVLAFLNRKPTESDQKKKTK